MLGAVFLGRSRYPVLHDQYLWPESNYSAATLTRLIWVNKRITLSYPPRGRHGCVQLAALYAPTRHDNPLPLAAAIYSPELFFFALIAFRSDLFDTVEDAAKQLRRRPHGVRHQAQKFGRILQRVMTDS